MKSPFILSAQILKIFKEWQNEIKKDKKPYTLFVFQNHGDRKMLPGLHFTATRRVHLNNTGCLDVLPEKKAHPVLHGTLLISEQFL
ncbi:hypothetical protein [Treponema sp.]|uniref:hypothetical protein n=1 Tax=Treponema sp. TaxID=166 RepID=UPI00388F197C